MLEQPVDPHWHDDWKAMLRLAEAAIERPARGLPGCYEWAARLQLENSNASLAGVVNGSGQIRSSELAAVSFVNLKTE
jgi:hypothetical protein